MRTLNTSTTMLTTRLEDSLNPIRNHHPPISNPSEIERELTVIRCRRSTEATMRPFHGSTLQILASMVAVAVALAGAVVSASIAGDETLRGGAQLRTGKEAGSCLQSLHRPVRP